MQIIRPGKALIGSQPRCLGTQIRGPWILLSMPSPSKVTQRNSGCASLGICHQHARDFRTLQATSGLSHAARQRRGLVRRAARWEPVADQNHYASMLHVLPQSCLDVRSVHHGKLSTCLEVPDRSCVHVLQCAIPFRCAEDIPVDDAERMQVLENSQEGHSCLNADAEFRPRLPLPE